jgi:hypothetical protein
VLIVLGLVFLLESLDVVAVGDFIWPVLFGLGGLAFLSVFVGDRTHWWAVIPGFTLLGLAGLIAWGVYGPSTAESWGATFFLGGISLSFWVIYLTNRENWWAIIPGGVLLTIALVAGLSSAVESGVVIGGVFFLGLALTFGALSLVKTPEGRLRWALIPAAVLFVMGLVITFAATDMFNYVWPAALILVGLYLLVRLLLGRSS